MPSSVHPTLPSPKRPSDSCPFEIQEYPEYDPALKSKYKTYIISEHDRYGELPLIYAKLLVPSKVIVLSDTGCGTEVTVQKKLDQRLASSTRVAHDDSPLEPRVWNLRTFLEATINPGGRIPYLVITTHCHYDHILGIGKLPPTAGLLEHGDDDDDDGKPNHNHNFPSPCEPDSRPKTRPATTVLSSSHDKSFITPYDHLQANSLCAALGLEAPRYEVGIWAEDGQQVCYTCRGTDVETTTLEMDNTRTGATTTTICTPYTILHTPGHTPDSLAWYDADQRVLCVGDSFYLCQTDIEALDKSDGLSNLTPSHAAVPVLFTEESDLVSWWMSLDKVEKFTRDKEREYKREQGREKEHARWANGEGHAERNMTEESCYHIVNDDESSPPSVPVAASPIFTPCHDANGGDDEDDDNWLMVDLGRSPSDSPSTFTAQPIRLAASHTTAHAPALPTILAMREFMSRILRDEVPRTPFPEKGDTGRWLWDDGLDWSNNRVRPSDAADNTPIIVWARSELGFQLTKRVFTVVAPLHLVEEARSKIPRDRWGG